MKLLTVLVWGIIDISPKCGCPHDFSSLFLLDEIVGHLQVNLLDEKNHRSLLRGRGARITKRIKDHTGTHQRKHY